MIGQFSHRGMFNQYEIKFYIPSINLQTNGLYMYL